MARVKRGVVAGRRHKKILKKAKGYFNARRKVFRTAKQAVIKAGQYAYRGRKEKKREFRALWITRINAAARLSGLSYSRLIDGLNKAGLGDRSQGARRSRRARFASLCGHRRKGQGQSPRLIAMDDQRRSDRRWTLVRSTRRLDSSRKLQWPQQNPSPRSWNKP